MSILPPFFVAENSLEASISLQRALDALREDLLGEAAGLRKKWLVILAI